MLPGRASVVETQEEVSVANGYGNCSSWRKVPTDFYTSNDLAVDERGRVLAMKIWKPATQVFMLLATDYMVQRQWLRAWQMQRRLEAIVGESVSKDCSIQADKNDITAKKGILAEPKEGICDSSRCLSCSTVCENCVDVCPNRANISIKAVNGDGTGDSCGLHV